MLSFEKKLLLIVSSIVNVVQMVFGELHSDMEDAILFDRVAICQLKCLTLSAS